MDKQDVLLQLVLFPVKCVSSHNHYACPDQCRNRFKMLNNVKVCVASAISTVPFALKCSHCAVERRMIIHVFCFLHPFR